MKRIAIATAVLAASLTAAQAGGPFDGEWTGGSPRALATSDGHACAATTATIRVADGKMTGTYSISSYTFKMGAKVANDGRVKGSWGGYPFTGKFTGTHFKGSYQSKECGIERVVNLEKKG
jgi:hypothetical protein